MKENEEHFVSAKLWDRKKCEFGLVVPVKFTAVTKVLRVTTNISGEILKKKDKIYSFYGV